MIYMLDTNAISYAVLGKGRVRENIIKHKPSQLVVSNITVAELRYGLAKQPRPKLEKAINSLLETLSVVVWDVNVSNKYGVFRRQLENQGLSLSYMDFLIATHAHVLGATLVSSDKGMINALGNKAVDWF
ncbi:PIN domain-containing protein [Paenalcaligenes sp.]|uniref:PIN domain-containing protein n=1 Tax=Paenalcaligenes sp. TaxID=1966342 RepID=UPI0026234329|nr:PIN domain-containing protein [Paenalcaligenes sp.]